jgi:glyoxylase-like metal-dependent hydrolase (beta-lactamase superfamily II)
MVKLLTLIVLLVSSTLPAAAQDIQVQTDRLSEKVLVLKPGKYQITTPLTIALATSKGIVVVDTNLSPRIAAELRKIIEREFGRKDFIYVINTHHHIDHTDGNQVFPEATFVGHANCPQQMRQAMAGMQTTIARQGDRKARLENDLKSMDAESDQAKQTRELIYLINIMLEDFEKDLTLVTPTMTFDDRLTLRLGDMTFEMIYYGAAHTDNNIFVYVPEEELLLVGDQYAPGSLAMFLPGSRIDVPRWIEVLDAFLDGEKPVKHVVGGHQMLSRDELLCRRDYIKTLWEGVVAASNEGLNLAAVKERLSLEKDFSFLTKYGFDLERVRNEHIANIEDFWAQLKKSAALELEALIEEKGIEQALSEYHKNIKSNNDYLINENEFNALGYRLLRAQKTREAIEVFKLNTETFPQSWNVWDSLGEACWRARDLETAVKYYEKSLELNPDNENGRNAISTIRGLELDIKAETSAEFQYSPGENTGLTGAYLGQTPPGSTPEVFAPGVVSTQGNFEFSCTFSPDGKEFYFTRRRDAGGLNTIMVCRWTEAGWTAPEPIPNIGRIWNNEPHITANGKKLYFGSFRPLPGETQPDYGIWMVERTAEGWSEPKYHGPGMFVTSTNEGTLYFTDVSPETPDQGIVRTRLVNGQYAEQEVLMGAVNSPTPAAHACIAPDESFIIFDATRPGGQGGEGDLYVSFKQPDGSWGEAINLGDEINTQGTNFCPSLSPDGKYLFYTAKRDIYWVSTEIIGKAKNQ